MEEKERQAHEAKIHRHLSKGKQVKNELGDILTLHSYMLRDNSDEVSEYEPDELSDLEIYLDPRDEQIEKLQGIIEVQQLEIQRILKGKEKPERKAYKKLDQSEKDELVLFAKSEGFVNKSHLARRFGISESSCRIILDEAGVIKIQKRT